MGTARVHPATQLAGLLFLTMTIAGTSLLSAQEGRPCEAGKVLDSCRRHMLLSALDELFRQLKDPYSAKLAAQIVVTREDVPAVCGSVNAKNGFGAYTGSRVFVYWLGAGADAVFPDQEKESWRSEFVQKALRKCAAADPTDFMELPAKYAKYADERAS